MRDIIKVTLLNLTAYRANGKTAWPEKIEK